jgi:hypothetical protein
LPFALPPTPVYDIVDHVTEAKRTGNNFHWYVYAYDDAGNRTTLTEKDQQGNTRETTKKKGTGDGG